jgi:PhzF family phenazine biosynthesis protein
MSRPFRKVDVFGATALSGNPLAVVHDADGLTATEMQAIARWMNLSETSFLVAPTNDDADYRVRIFTLRGELPFAGHPTLGTCHAWLEAGGVPQAETIVQECGLGLVQLRQADQLAFAAPPLLRSGPVDERNAERVLAVLGLNAEDALAMEWVDNGPGWIGMLLEDRDAVLALEPDIARDPVGGQIDIGVVGPHPEGSDVAFEVRAFFADHLGRLNEDPVTGSLNASLAQWLIGTGRAPASYVAAQGTALGRSGRISITAEGNRIWVGGATRTVVEGFLL